MYAYCGNNPVNRIDPDGHAWKDVKNWFSKTWNNIKTWAKNTFGREHTKNDTISKKVVPEPSPIVITTGTTTTTTTYKKNNSNPIVGYTSTNSEGRSLTSTMGAKINISKVSIDFSLGFDDIGITGAYMGEYSTESIGVRLNINEMKAGLEYSSTIQWDADITNTKFTNVSISALGVAMAYALVTGYAPAVQR